MSISVKRVLWGAVLAFLPLVSSLQSAQAQFASQAAWGTCGGSGNAQTMSLPNVQNLSDILGVYVSCTPAAQNSSSATLTVNSLSAVPIQKPTSGGLTALTGGEVTTAPISYMYDGTEFVIVSNPYALLPPPTTVVTVYASGSGTYATPTVPAPRYLRIEMCGGGSGGTGGGTGGSSSSAGGNTTFGSAFLTANGGPASISTVAGSFPTPAAASGGDDNISGGLGSFGSNDSAGGGFDVGGTGASSPFGAGGPGGSFGIAAPPASAAPCAGGGGGATTGAQGPAGPGGNAGAYLRKLITSPAASYAYSVGSGSLGGSPGTSGQPGGSGSNGRIDITPVY